MTVESLMKELDKILASKQATRFEKLEACKIGVCLLGLTPWGHERSDPDDPRQGEPKDPKVALAIREAQHTILSRVQMQKTARQEANRRGYLKRTGQLETPAHDADEPTAAPTPVAAPAPTETKPEPILDYFTREALAAKRAKEQAISHEADRVAELQDAACRERAAREKAAAEARTAEQARLAEEKRIADQKVDQEAARIEAEKQAAFLKAHPQDGVGGEANRLSCMPCYLQSLQRAVEEREAKLQAELEAARSNGVLADASFNGDIDVAYVNPVILTNLGLSGKVNYGSGDLSSFYYDHSGVVGASTGVDFSPAPEPSSLILFGSGVLGLGAIRKRKIW